MTKYRVTATLNEKQITDEVEAVSENHAWLAACSKYIPERLYNGKVEELPTREEQARTITELREALKLASNLIFDHHEIGHIRRAHENPFDDCEACTKDYRLKKVLDAARALKGGA